MRRPKKLSHHPAAIRSRAFRERNPGYNAERQREHRKRNPKPPGFYGKTANELKVLRKKRRHWRLKYPIKSLLRSAMKRAIIRGTRFEIVESDIVIPKVCPILGIELFVGNRSLKNNSPSIDEIIPGKGYVKGNIVVISWRANRLKSDATFSEIEKIYKFLRKYK